MDKFYSVLWIDKKGDLISYDKHPIKGFFIEWEIEDYFDNAIYSGDIYEAISYLNNIN